LEPRFDILGLGAVAVDDLVYVEAFPPPDAKAPVLRSERQCGGLTATALVAAARLGSKCAYAGVLGRDELSSYAMERMRREGIDLTYLLQREEARPVHSFIVVDEKRQTRNIFPNSLKTVGADDQWPSEEVIQSIRVLLVDHIGLKGMLRAARIARESNIPVVGDFERVAGPEFQSVLDLVDHLILSQPFAQKLTGKSAPVDALKVLWRSSRKVLVITCGKEGCWYISSANPEQPRHQPAYLVRTVDTTGCGDVFHGAYASALARGLELDDRIRSASATAALKATQPGGQAGIPDRGTVEKFLQERT
jgi:sugar/nucleoside kinase (ribokinase family)